LEEAQDSRSQDIKDIPFLPRFFAAASAQYGDEFDEDGDFMELDGYEPGNASGSK